MTTSAALLLFRRRDAALEVLLGRMGGPFWARRDAGAWSIPKGELSCRRSRSAAGRTTSGSALRRAHP